MSQPPRRMNADSDTRPNTTVGGLLMALGIAGLLAMLILLIVFAPMADLSPARSPTYNFPPPFTPPPPAPIPSPTGPSCNTGGPLAATVLPNPPLGVPVSVSSARVASSGFANLTSTRCLSANQSLRACTSFEGITGGITGVSPGHPGIPQACYCGPVGASDVNVYGTNVVQFVLILTNASLTAPLVPSYTTNKLFINGTSPGPTLNVTQFDW